MKEGGPNIQLGEQSLNIFHKKKKNNPWICDSFDKGNIFISWRYQLYQASATTQCPNGNIDAHH
jgi:hypothetical protein